MVVLERPAQEVASAGSSVTRGSSPLPVLLGASGLVIIALSFYLSRTRFTSAALIGLFWVGFVVLTLPVLMRLLGSEATRPERLGLVVGLGVLLYGLKVLHDPIQFVISDEFIHLVSAQHIVATHRLLTPTSIQGGAVASSFPGLEAVTSSVSQLSGLSLFVCGIIVIGVARMMMMVAVYLFAERMSGSARAAGIAGALFVANANFLFYSAQFSYESLAFPLFLIVIVLLLTRARDVGPMWSMTAAIVIIVAALVPTHHLTAYLLAIVLWLSSALSLRRGWRRFRAVGLAAFTTAAAAAWLAFVAVGTPAYLGAILRRTTDGIGSLASGTSRRAPFESTVSPGLAQPLPERLVAYLALTLLAVGLLVAIVRTTRALTSHSPLGVLVVAGAVGLLALYPLRASANAWETANRGQEILFPTAAVLLALLIVRPPTATGWRRALCATVVLVVICGGVISGWPYPLRLPQPLAVRAEDGRTIVPQGLEAARWAIANLGHRTTYAADVSTGRELAAAGARMTYIAADGDGQNLLEAKALPGWQLGLLRTRRVDAVVLDRRKLSANNLEGYFFAPARAPGRGAGNYPAATRRKFAAIDASRVFSSGAVVIMDVRSLHEPSPACSAVGPPQTAAGVTCRRGRTLVTYGRGDQVTLPSSRLRLLARHTTRRRRAIVLSLLVQVQNFGARPLTLAPGPRSFSIRIRSALVRARRSPRAIVIPGRSNREATVTFVLSRRAARAARRSLTLRYRPLARAQAGSHPRSAPRAAAIPLAPRHARR